MDLALDSTGDLAFVNGELQRVEGREAIAQHLRVRLRMFRGEWFLDQRLGVPWLQHVLIKRPNPVLLRSIFREAALTTPGIREVRKLDMTLDTVSRRLSVSMILGTEDGAPIPFDFSEPPLDLPEAA